MHQYYYSVSLPAGKYFLCEYHSLEYRDRYIVCKLQGRVTFLSEISSRGEFVCLYIFSKKTCIYKFVNSRKKYFRLENIFFANNISILTSPSILRQVGQGQILRSWYFFKRYIQPRGPITHIRQIRLLKTGVTGTIVRPYS